MMKLVFVSVSAMFPCLKATAVYRFNSLLFYSVTVAHKRLHLATDMVYTFTVFES
jgi:hypothetical protein